MDGEPSSALDKVIFGLSIYWTLAYSALSGWMIYFVHGFRRLDRVTDQVDSIFITFIFLHKCIEGCALMLDSQQRSSFIRNGDERHAASFQPVLLHTLLIIRFFAWIEQLKTDDESTNVKFCFACIAVTTFDLLPILPGFLYDLVSSISWGIGRLFRKGRSRETKGHTERDSEAATEASRP